MKRGRKTQFGAMYLLIAIAIIAFIAVAVTEFQNFQPKACTEEAKVCPDGSAVWRVPPNCEFTPCPSESCENDSDCVGKECCHPISCINKAYKEVCNLFCTAVCEGPLDCGAGSCGCVNNRCVVIPK